MVSIFRDYYIKNSERLEANFDKKRPKSNGFEKVLADIDKTRDFNNLSPNKSSFKNVEKAENKPIETTARARFGGNNPVLFIKNDNELINAENVKIPNLNVNEPTQIELPKQSEMLPEMPKVISAQVLPEQSNQSIDVAFSNIENDEIKEIIIKAGLHHGIDPGLSLAVAQTESSFVHTAVSSDGHASKGLFQLLDSTGRDLMEAHEISEKYSPFDPEQNSFLGVGYLRHLMDLFSGDSKISEGVKTRAVNSADELEKFALAAYNAGQGSVARAQYTAESQGKDPTDFEVVSTFLPASTRRYVDKVLKLREQFALNNTDSANS